MTARMVRASKSRFFVGLAILLLTIGFVAIFHSSQQQLDELRQMEVRCERQQESLNSQILREFVVYFRCRMALMFCLECFSY